MMLHEKHFLKYIPEDFTINQPKHKVKRPFPTKFPNYLPNRLQKNFIILREKFLSASDSSTLPTVLGMRPRASQTLDTYIHH